MWPKRKKEERKIIPKIVDSTFRCNAKGPIMMLSRTKICLEILTRWPPPPPAPLADGLDIILSEMQWKAEYKSFNPLCFFSLGFYNKIGLPIGYKAPIIGYRVNNLFELTWLEKACCTFWIFKASQLPKLTEMECFQSQNGSPGVQIEHWYILTFPKYVQTSF